MEIPAISFQDASFAYGDVAETNAAVADAAVADGNHQMILRDVSFSVSQGEFVSLMGSNGSGKSTLAMLLCATLMPVSGAVFVLGQDTRRASQFDIRRHIGFVMQNPDDQLVASIVENEVAFGPENLGIAPDECRVRVAQALSQVGLSGFEKREVNSLSGGQKQRVAIAGALAMKPEILVLDEAASMLDEPSRAQISKLARRLTDTGTTVFMITHSETDARAADRVIALKHGRIAMDDTPKLAFADNRLQRELEWPTEIYSCSCEDRTLSTASNSAEDAAGETPLVELRDVSFFYNDAPSGTSGPYRVSDPSCASSPLCVSSPSSNSDGNAYSASAPSSVNAPSGFALQNVNLAIRKGELLAVVGPTGSGKSTIIQLMNGLLQPTSGSVLINGSELQSKQAANMARRNAGLVFQYPEHQMFANSVYDEVSYGPRNLGLSYEEIDARTHEALEAVGLPFDDFAMRNPFTLSGGEQRRVAIASVLSMRPAVLILDEPCAGLDPAMHARFLRLLFRLHSAGQTIVMVTHEMADVRAIATRVLEL